MIRSSWVAVKSLVYVVLDLAVYGSVVFLTFLGLRSLALLLPRQSVWWGMVCLLAPLGLLLWAVQLVRHWHSFWIDWRTARAWAQDGWVLPEARG